VANYTKELTLSGRPISGVMLDILEHGGLVPYIREHRRLMPREQ
jgi:hypothetical protein